MNAIPLLVAALLAGEPGPMAKSIRMQKHEFSDLAEALHVQQHIGIIELSAQRRKSQIVIEFYRDGKKLSQTVDSVIVDDGGFNKDPNDQVQFALHIIDLDYLKLGDGKPRHCRLRIKVGKSTIIHGSSHADVPKQLIDLTTLTSGGQFQPDASTADTVPVCWMIGNTKTVKSATTPVKLVAANPKGDLAIVSIRLTE